MALRLRLEGVTYSYPLSGRGEAPAVSDVSLAVEPGRVLCLAGPNGSGKSTLAQVCAGLLPLSSGALFYGDARVEGRSAYREFRSRAGMLFQNPEDQLFADTVVADVAFGARNQGLTGEALDRRVEEASRYAGLSLEETGHRSPFSLSGGEQRRAALAGVFAMRPELLLLDEPFIGLDHEGRRALERAVLDYRELTGATVIIVTHELSHVWGLADAFGLLSGGRLIALESRESMAEPGVDLAALGMQLPQWGAVARELLAVGISVEDPADPGALARGLARRRASGAPE